MDLEKRLKKIVLKTGEVNSVLGGFKIRVINPPLFPWYQVIDQLIEHGQEVWGWHYIHFISKYNIR